MFFISDRLLNNIISILNTPISPNENNKKFFDNIVSVLTKPVKFESNSKTSKITQKTIQNATDKPSLDSQLSLERFEIISSLELLERLKANNNLDDYSEQQRYYFLETYQKLRSLALNSSDIVNNPDWEIDNWEIDVKIVLILLTNSSSQNKEDIQNILWLSPQVRRLKLSLSKDDYDLQAFEYVDRVYQWAKKLQQCSLR